MTDEQTNKTDTPGKETDKPVEKDGEPISDYDKALELVKRREEATKKEEEVLDRKEKLAANTMLGGEGGGRQESEPKEETPKEYRTRINKELAEGKTEFGD